MGLTTATPLPPLAKLAIWAVLVLSLLRLLIRQRGVPSAMTLRADGRLLLVGGDGDNMECAVDPATTVLPWLVVLKYRTGRAVESLVLPVDALGIEGHRQLRVWLRWQANVDSV
jgi:hypothetical protein